MSLESYLTWYQQRIGLYDKQSWETTVEQRILRGLSYSPRKTAKQKTDLIDVDLVRGSTFPKAKPQSDVWLAGLHGIIRLVLLPIYIRWWIKETSYVGMALVVSMYCSVITACLIYFTMYENERLKVVPTFEVLLPVCLLILLSVILSQMASTRRKGIKYAFHGQRNGKNMNNDRTSRGKRNTTVTGNKGYSRPFKSNCSRNVADTVDDQTCTKTFDSSNRSHSEDLHPIHTLEYQIRSASENNILFHRRKDASKSDCTLQTLCFESVKDKFKNCGFDEQKTVVDEDVDDNLRYRKCANVYRYEKDTTKSSLGFNGFIKRHPFKQRSDISDDLEEGCHADCESPTSDEEECNLEKKKSKLRLGSNLLSQRRSLSPQKLNAFQKPDHTLPVVMVQEDGLVSSCESDREGMDTLRPPNLSRQKLNAMLCNGVGTNYLDLIIQWFRAWEGCVTTASSFGCKIWEDGEMKKVDLSVLDISSAIISRVDSLHQSSNYLMFGLVMAGILSWIPSLYRIVMFQGNTSIHDTFSVSAKTCNATCSSTTVNQSQVLAHIFGSDLWCVCLIILSGLNRLVLGSCFFFLLSVAERTFKQRFLYAKHFCYLTSARRARKYDLPHFRLNKVVNIKSWLSIRSCLKKRGPQHSVDVIISATFIVTLLLVFYLGVEALKDEDKTVQPLHNCELFVWCFAVSIYLIRFMTLGALINKKYSNPSVLITEQINMYLHMEQNPQKKDNLMLANNVLKLVSVLLKELDSPFKISGLSANTLLYNITKFGILSACSGVLSNLLGFKLKLHNIKFR